MLFQVLIVHSLSSIDIYTLPNVNGWLVGNSCIAQGDQLGAL